MLSLDAATAWAAGPVKSIVDVTADGAEKLFTPSSDEVTVTRSTDPAAPGINVSIKSGKEGYPGLNLKQATPLDLSNFGHVEAKFTNTGGKNLTLSLRVDNAGNWQDGPFNTESITIKPGATGTVSTVFGFSYGLKPGYKLDPAAVSNILIFALKSSEEQSFRIESLQAAGPKGEAPPIDPKTIRIAPKDGIILGAGTTLDQAQIKAAGAKGTLTATTAGQAIHIDFSAKGKGNESVSLEPSMGRWSLRFFTDIRVKVKNDGTTPVTPKLQATSDGNGVTDLIAGPELAPGASAEITIPFAPAIPWTGIPNSGDKPTIWSAPKGSGTTFASDATAAIKISADHNDAASLTVESIQAKVTPAVLPDWLGKRPPVEGDWTKTLSEEFDGKTINESVWNITGDNYWDKKTHWSKDDLILDNGMLKMHFEKKTGFHNDDPKAKQTPYACGYLDTYGKWVQRYGYFEARVKLPVAEGLWPTFWLMPDRGVAAGPQWKRGDTGNGGMEFDIMEHLTRWGPYRYNIAHHWDGYQKNHKQNGCTFTYNNPDKDGFITVGFLWLPGQTHYYCNGREVGRWEDPRISAIPSNIIFEVTTGGWDNNAVDDKQLPVDYVIDYVRVWQRKDLASEVDGPVKAAATTQASAPAGAK